MSQQQASGPSTELVALLMFFAGFALGVQAERTHVAPTAVARAIAATPATVVASSAAPHAMRGMTGLLQLGGAVAP